MEQKITIQQIANLRETEDKVEFKAATGGSFSYNGGNKPDVKDRRKCVLGYVVAFSNEEGGHLIFGVADSYPHQIVGTSFSINSIGKLEQDIYRDLGIRVNIYELFDESKNRVVVIEIPSRPIGKVYKFEDVALMRVGEELKPMDEKQYLKIVNEQEKDFSDKICEGLQIEDLDENAIDKLKKAYALKQKNEIFQGLPNRQALSDLNLINIEQVTYAALVLLGKQEAIRKYLPQSRISIEFRNSISQINFDNREFFDGAYFITVERIWQMLDTRNGSIPVQNGAYIFDIPFFNAEVIREALNNAVAHRNYQLNSEVLIKQFPQAMRIISPGGLPLGVTLENLLTVNSTPRNRLLADVLAKTGMVERSSQGVDKIYYQSISEGKPEPDYSSSDDYQVELLLSSIVEDKAFATFIKQIQEERASENKLSVHDVITLKNVKLGIDKLKLNIDSVKKLEDAKLIERVGRTKAQRFILAKRYYIIANNPAGYTYEKSLDFNQSLILISNHFKSFSKVKMSDFESLLHFLSREQVKYLVGQLLKQGLLTKDGVGKGTTYSRSELLLKREKDFNRALELGYEQMRKQGELPHND